MQFSLLLLFVVVVVAVAISRSSHRPAWFGHRSAVTGAAPVRAQRDGLHDALVRWRDAGLLDARQVEAIERYEDEHRPPAPRVPLAAEAIGYVGGALVLTAVALLVGRRWDDLASGVRVAVLFGPAALTAALGWWSGRASDPSLRRLGSLLWVLSCAAFTGALAELYIDVWHDGDPPAHGGVLLVAGLATVWAAVLWWRRPQLLQHLVVFAGVVATALGLVDAVYAANRDSTSSMPWGLGVIGAGVAWGVFTQITKRPLVELGAALGAVAALFGAQSVRVEATVWGLWLGIAITVALIALGVATARLELLLPGAVGTFQWSPQLALHYLSDSLGTEATLLVVGVLLIVLAAGFTRLSRRLLGRARARA